MHVEELEKFLSEMRLWDGRATITEAQLFTQVDESATLLAKADPQTVGGLTTPPSALQIGRECTLWLCDGGVAQELVPFGRFQLEPRYDVPLTEKCRQYFESEGTLSQQASVPDFRRIGPLLGGEARGYSPNTSNNLFPVATALSFRALQVESLAERLWCEFLAAKTVEAMGGYGINTAGGNSRWATLQLKLQMMALVGCWLLDIFQQMLLVLQWQINGLDCSLTCSSLSIPPGEMVLHYLHGRLLAI